MSEDDEWWKDSEDRGRSFREVGEDNGWTLSTELGKLEVSGDLGRETLRVSLQR